MIGIALLLFILVLGGASGFIIGYVLAYRSAARKLQHGFPVLAGDAAIARHFGLILSTRPLSILAAGSAAV